MTVAVKSLRNPPLDIKLSGQGLNTSVVEIKAAVAGQAGVPADKIRVLHKKKPVPDTKALKDLVADGDMVVEFSVMIMGGAAAAAPGPARGSATDVGGDSTAGGVVAQGSSGKAVLETEEFWNDLGGFLQQRIRDEAAAGELVGQFRGAWQAMR